MAAVATRQSFNGTVTYTNGATTGFSSAYDADFDQPASLSRVAGTYTGQVALAQGVQSTNLTISATGAISGTGGGCALTGTATPRTDGNVYNLSIAFGSSPCAFANQTFSGLAYFDATTRILYAAAPNAARTDGLLFVGVKP